MKRKADAGYNERLFSSGLRKRLHQARFHWIHKKLTELDYPFGRVIELGCFDGKVLEFFPKEPDYYVGYDADWEDALTLAREKWKQYPSFRFRYCTTPDEMAVDEDRFDIAIAMETLEHLPEDVVEPFLAKLAGVIDGYILVTVPNEKGVVFFFKYIFKLLFGEVEKHTLSEFVNATLGRMGRIQRGHHKGFDYRHLIAQLAEYFEIVEVTGLPIPALPKRLSFTIAIVARKKIIPSVLSVAPRNTSAPT